MSFTLDQLAALKEQVERAIRAQAEVDTLCASITTSLNGKAVSRRGQLSAAGRRSISRAQKRRWAKLRAKRKR